MVFTGKLQQAHRSTAFLPISKVLEHKNQRMKVRILNPCYKRVSRNFRSARASVISTQTHNGAQEMEEERERGRVS